MDIYSYATNYSLSVGLGLILLPALGMPLLGKSHIFSELAESHINISSPEISISSQVEEYIVKVELDLMYTILVGIACKIIYHICEGVCSVGRCTGPEQWITLILIALVIL